MTRLGLIGVGRGSILFEYCEAAKNACLTAVCDMDERMLKKTRTRLGDPAIQYYTDYDEFLKGDFDTVFLANYATEHATFAIKAMRAGKNVISEVLPVETMAQAVELIETVEETGRKYILAENFCFFPAVLEIARRFRSGELGDFEYGEGEYLHNCESIWPGITGGRPEHWRNTMSAFYYCSHSIGPLLHSTGLRPVKVSGFECPHNARMDRMGALAGHTAVEMITLENGAVIKSVHGVGASRNSVWYTFYGSNGRMETAREDACLGDTKRVYANLGAENRAVSYEPDHVPKALSRASGHGNADGICLYNAFEYLNGSADANIIDVYEAIDIWMPGFFGYLSACEDNRAMVIPNLRNREEREAYRHDNRCTTPSVAGDALLPSFTKGNPVIPDSVYEAHQRTAAEQHRKLDSRPQLRMTWYNHGEAPRELVLPEGITVRTLPEVPDAVEQWLNICSYGLIPPNETRACFDAYLTDYRDFDPDYCYFLMDGEKAVGTITLIRHKEENEGYIHMVALMKDYRGRGLGTAMMTLAMNKAIQLGLPVVRLTTDDWRYFAIRTYLRAGFERDLSTEDYVKRWNSIRVLIE